MTMPLRSCKFCGCTEHRPCRLVAIELAGLDPCIFSPNRIVPVPSDAITRVIPCGWLLEDVCSNPACVEKAYAEARPLAETIQIALRLGLIEEAA
jgi:hypothetical protein